MRTLLCLLALASLTHAADVTAAVEVPLAKAKKKSDRAAEPPDKATLRLWIPDDLKTVRGVVFNPFDDRQTEQKHWQAAARAWGFGVVGANYLGVDQAEFAKSFQAGMKQFAADLKRPELAHAPACLIGISAGAGMCVTFAEQMPERVIAVAAVCLDVGPTTPATDRIPFLTVFGEKDGTQMEILRQKLIDARAARNVTWSTAVQWGRKHEFGAANNLILPFFDTAIRGQLKDPAKPARLTRFDPDEPDGWGTDFIGWGHVIRGVVGIADREGYGWVPDKATAYVWQGFVWNDPRLRIAEPTGLGDGQPFAPLAAGKPVKVVVTGTKGLRTIKVRSGDKELAAEANDTDADRVTFEVKLPAGIHGLLAEGFEADKGRTYSRPVAVIVEK
jgi:hypothetical protein